MDGRRGRRRAEFRLMDPARGPAIGAQALACLSRPATRGCQRLARLPGKRVLRVLAQKLGKDGAGRGPVAQVVVVDLALGQERTRAGSDWPGTAGARARTARSSSAKALGRQRAGLPRRAARRPRPCSRRRGGRVDQNGKHRGTHRAHDRNRAGCAAAGRGPRVPRAGAAPGHRLGRASPVVCASLPHGRGLRRRAAGAGAPARLGRVWGVRRHGGSEAA